MLHIYRSSRIESLADMLAARLHRQRPRSALAGQTVLVGHLGMKRWLTLWLAERRLASLPRVAANLDMLLPSEWLDMLARSVLGSAAIAILPYRRPALRWRIYELLAELDDGEVAAYLGGADSGRRRFQLADRLAGLYGQYLVYRRDWLSLWGLGEAAADPAMPVLGHWQGQLWRRILQGIGQGHRGQRMRRLLERLSTMPADPDQPALHVFGLSHLPPDVLTALQQLSVSRDVHVYFPDPCRELWEDLRVRRDQFATSLDGGAFLALKHPLLASLGRLGQHYSLLLNALDSASDDRDCVDAELQAEQAPSRLLQQLQDSIRTLQPSWSTAPPDAARADATLRIHLCHTRLRELEVLKDALLDQLTRQPDLQPRQIVVMAPNMAVYAPLIPAVFGQPGRSGEVLPFHLADVALSRSHPLLTAFAQLLELPTQRITRSQVLALLSLPAVMRRLKLDSSQLAAVERWLQRSHVAWGLDGPMKADFGAAEVGANSFDFGFDRMAAGFVLGREGGEWLLDGMLPADPVNGPDAQGLAALWALLDLLRDWREQTGTPRPLSEWSKCLRIWIEGLFLADWQDADEQAALTALERVVTGLGREADNAGVDPVVKWAVVHEALGQALDGVPERQPFLAGGITFCGMVPQRAIPFRVIALLGLNDGEYPRVRSDNQLDLMQQHPRLGDRVNRMEDRYLFLEALMSARDAIHLSWVGEGVQDGKPRNPALPLAELMRFLDQVHEIDESDPQIDRPWLLRHALQPFDARYFLPAGATADTYPRWFSYSMEFAAACRQSADQDWVFLQDAPRLPHASAAAAVELRSVCDFYAKPAQWLCLHALALSRETLSEDGDTDVEPLTSSRETLDQTPLLLLGQTIAAGRREIPAQPPAQLLYSGQLPAGALGERAYEALREEAQVLLDGVRSLPPFAQGAAEAAPVAIDLDIAGLRVIGELTEVYRSGDELWLVKVVNSKSVNYSKLLPLFLQWAALRISRPDCRCRVALMYLKTIKKELRCVRHDLDQFPDDPALLRASLSTLLEQYLTAETTAGSYFPATSFAYALELAEGKNDPLGKARKVWAPDFGTGERDYSPGYNRVLAANDSFLQAGTPAHRRFTELAALHMELLQGTAWSGSQS